MLRKIFFTLLFIPLILSSEDLYLECKSIGLYRDTTVWIDNSCQIVEKAKLYYELRDNNWKSIQRRHTKMGKFYIQPNGEKQLCGEEVESFEELIDRATKTGKAIDSEWYGGAKKNEFFSEFEDDGVKELGVKAVVFQENEIVLNTVSGKLLERKHQRPMEWARISRLTGEVFMEGRVRANCEPINRNKYNKIMNEWSEGFEKIQKAERLKRKF